MSDFAYISMFSGIGGFEHPSIQPRLLCESDAACKTVLERKYPRVPIVSQVEQLVEPPKVEFVVGGWPCQDISSAGKLAGIQSKRSGLFFEMLRVAQRAEAHTLIGENVPNLLTINRGRDFQTVLDTLSEHGYSHVSWRLLNARAFGLPQQRRRLFIVASKTPQVSMALHAKLPSQENEQPAGSAFGFYWTGGKRAICFSGGFVPALKIGATDDKGRAPVAVFYDQIVRKLTPSEFLALQGFSDFPDVQLSNTVLLRMAGNAVPVPMGQFVLRSISDRAEPAGIRTSFAAIGPSGVLDNGLPWTIQHESPILASNLYDILDHGCKHSLSAQAAAGLIVRSTRAGNPMPRELFDVLAELARDRSRRIHPSRANSFNALDAMRPEVEAFMESLPNLTTYHSDELQTADS